jgi:hypothetical protein
MRKILIVDVDTDRLDQAIQETGTTLEETGIEDAIYRESGWMNQSGIVIESVLDYEEYKIQKGPIPYEDLEAKADDRGYLTAYVYMDLDEILECSLEDFLDVISMKAVGSELLRHIDYEIVQNLSPSNGIVIKVTGSVDYIIDNN